MNLTQVMTVARDLMNQHGVGHLKLELSGTKRALGQCVSRGNVAHTIRLSRHWMAHIPEAEIRDTILHEIAHAIAGHKAGHGWEWKAVCRRIGANPNRIADLPQDMVLELKEKIANYKAVCTKCASTHLFYRLTEKWRQGKYVCAKCRSPFKIYNM